MKKVIAIIVSMIMVLAMVPLNAFAGEIIDFTNPEDGYNYEVYLGDEYAWIMDFKSDAVNVNVPDTINGKIVTFIDPSVFEGKSVEEVVLPDSVKEIRFEAFRDCVNLKKVNIPANTELIGFSTF